MTQKEAVAALSQYNGKRLEDIGQCVNAQPSYARNTYRLPNGMVVREDFDENYESGSVYLTPELFTVGETDGDGVFYATTIALT